MIVNTFDYLKTLLLVRPAHDAKSFYPYTEVLGTMLHELVHMVRVSLPTQSTDESNRAFIHLSCH